jgi:phenylacetic acid degradation operon negative regulatory protein
MREQSPRHLILSLFGLYARADPQWLSVRSLITLMADLDVDAAATRSSVSRLKKRGVLESAKVGGQAGYRLSASALAVLREGDARIWARPRAAVADGWLIVVFSVPEAERGKRHELRSLLTRLGFGTAAPGVWVAPGTAYDETLGALDRAGLAAYTELFRGDYLGAGDASRPEADPARAFTAYVPMLTAWRRLPYLDPGIPLELLPRDWPGIRAGDLFTELDGRLRDPAAKHAHARLED